MPPIDISRLRRQQVMSPMQFPVGQQIDFAAQPPITPIEPGISYPEHVPGPFDANFRAQDADNQFIADRMRQLYNPSYEAQDRLNAMIDEFPQRREPSTLRKIGASMMGLRNVGKKNQSPADAAFTTQLQDRFMDKPYHQGVEDFKAKSEPVLKAADIERAGNVNERGFANQIISQELAQRKQTEVERNNKAKQDIAQQRADIYALRSSRPNWKFDFSGPTVLMADPATGQIRDSKIPTGSLSEADKINLSGEWGVRREEAATDRALAVEGARQPNRVELENIDAENQRRLKQTPSADSGNALEVARDRMNEAIKMRDTMPGAASWLVFEKGGVRVKEPSMWTSVKDQKIRQAVIDRLYRIEKPPPNQPGQGQNQLRIDLPGTNLQQPPQGQQGQVLRKSVTNKRTGQKAFAVSTDGGKTWELENAPKN